MIEFFFGLPDWLGAILVLAGAVALALGGHVIARKITPKVSKEETDLAVALMGVVAAFIGIMLAFAAVQVWDDYGQADKAVALEASAVSELYRDLQVYGPEAAPVQAQIRVYVHDVLDEEWPKLAHGESGPKTTQALIDLFNQAGKLQPQTPRQQVIYAEVFKNLNEVVGYRRARLITARAELPSLFWAVVLAGSTVIVGFTYVFPVTRTNSMVIGGLALSLALIFLFILEVNRPFEGDYQVDSREIRDLPALFDKISAPPAQGGLSR
jgi:hypothetical protein